MLSLAAPAALAPLLLLPLLASGRAGLPEGLPSVAASSNVSRTAVRFWPFWDDLTDDVCDADKGKQCQDGIICFQPRSCSLSEDCPDYNVCVYGTCQCKFAFPPVCEKYINSCESDVNSLGCTYGFCYSRSLQDEPWTTMEGFLIGGIVCFFCIAVGLCACRSLITSSSPRRRTSDGAQSVNSMQRWIDERLRDRPPRYDEMSAAEGSAGSGRSAAAATPPATVQLEMEKPPSYDFAMAEHQTSSFYEQPPVGEGPPGPPPPYSALAMALMEDDGMGFSNPCFEGDDVDIHAASALPSSEPASSASALSLTSVSSLESSSSFRSTSSSCSGSSYLSASSSGVDPPGPPLQLLTVSQAVAIQEMMLGEVSQSPSGRGTSTQTWTSF